MSEHGDEAPERVEPFRIEGTAAGRPLGVVLAGGRARRFGSDKRVARLDGTPLVEQAYRVLASVVDDVVLSVAEADVPGLEAVDRVRDAFEDAGPLAGVLAGLRRAREAGRPGALVLAVDLPGVRKHHLVELLPGPGTGAGVVALEERGSGERQPLAGFYSVELEEDLRRFLTEGGRRVDAFLAHHAVEWRPVGGTGERPAWNVNTPADLSRGPGPRRGGPVVVCVIGKKKSGKTTVAVDLMRALSRRGYRVASAKHGHHFRFDGEGSDSWKHVHGGGAFRVVLSGPEGYAVFGDWGERGEASLEALVESVLPDAEIVVAEGHKTAPYPKIEVFRSAAHPGPLLGTEEMRGHRYLAVVTDVPSFQAPCPVVSWGDPEGIERVADEVEGLLSGDRRTTEEPTRGADGDPVSGAGA